MTSWKLFPLALSLACMSILGCGRDEVVAPPEADVPDAPPSVEPAPDGEGFSMSFTDGDGRAGEIRVGGDEGFSMNIDGGEGGVQMRVGSEAAIPDTFPKDVPVYRGMKLNLSQAGDDGFVIQGTVTDDIDRVTAFIKSEAEKQGWSEESTFSTTGGEALTMFNYTKGERTLNISVVRQDAETMIQIATSGT